MPNLSTFDGTRIPVGFVWRLEQERLCEAAGKSAEVADINRSLLDKAIGEINEEWAEALGKKVDTAVYEIIYPFTHMVEDKPEESYKLLDSGDSESSFTVQGIFLGIQVFDTRKFRHPQRQRHLELFIPSMSLDNVVIARSKVESAKPSFVPLDKIAGPTTVIEA